LSRQGWDWFCDSKKENVQNKVNDRKTTPPQETSVKRPAPDDNGVSGMFHVRKRRDRSCPWLPILIGARGRNRIRIDRCRRRRIDVCDSSRRSTAKGAVKIALSRFNPEVARVTPARPSCSGDA
jgi:hypothetical protein